MFYVDYKVLDNSKVENEQIKNYFSIGYYSSNHFKTIEEAVQFLEDCEKADERTGLVRRYRTGEYDNCISEPKTDVDLGTKLWVLAQARRFSCR